MSLSTILGDNSYIDKLRYHDIMISINSMNRLLVNFEDGQYDLLKEEAFKKRKSLSAVVREAVDEKLGDKLKKSNSKESLSEILKRTRGILAGQDFYIDEKKRRQRALKATENLRKW